MNTTENNKLIAEFMGYKLISCNRGKAWDIGKSIPIKDHLFPIQGVLHTGNELKFHTSWDWLMPVVKKVMQKDYEFLVFEELKYKWWKADIDAVYSALVEFIKEYDNN